MIYDRYDFSPLITEEVKRKAELIIDLQKQIGIQAVGIGDQDIILGLKFVEKAAAQGFPFVCANLRDRKGNPTKIPAYRIIEIKGIKVGVFGLAPSNFPYKTPRVPDPDFQVTDPIEAAQKTVDILNKQGVGLIIALSSIGLDDNKVLAAKAPGINLIISGHDERMLNTPMRVGETLIFQSYNKGMYLGEARLVMIPGDTHFAEIGERQQARNEIIALDAQKRVFAGAIANMPEVQAQLTEIASKLVSAKERAKELLKATSLVENTLVPLDTSIVEREDIARKIADFKDREAQIQNRGASPPKTR